jgi:hypothetical protein
MTNLNLPFSDSVNGALPSSAYAISGDPAVNVRSDWPREMLRMPPAGLPGL